MMMTRAARCAPHAARAALLLLATTTTTSRTIQTRGGGRGRGGRRRQQQQREQRGIGIGKQLEIRCQQKSSATIQSSSDDSDENRKKKKKKRVLVISGPTSVGKSSVAISIAKRVDGEIVSADSVQVYRNLNVGSAKLSKEDMQSIRHHMLDLKSPVTEDFDVGEFYELANGYIDDIHARGKAAAAPATLRTTATTAAAIFLVVAIIINSFPICQVPRPNDRIRHPFRRFRFVVRDARLSNRQLPEQLKLNRHR